MKSSMLTFSVILAALLPNAVVPPAAQAAPPPSGRISLATLREATLDVPSWPADGLRCPSGRLRFHRGEAPVSPRAVPEGRPPYGEFLTILSATYGDIDRDGADETVAVLGCLIEGGTKQLVAYDRNAAGGIVSRGRVTATTGQVRDLRENSVRVDRSGRVTVRVADYQRCCADRTPQKWQTRGYALRDGRFRQVSGPTRMPLNRRVTEIGLTTGDLVLGPAKGAYRYGTLAVTVHHRRGARPGQVTLTFTAPDGLQRAGKTWTSGSFTARVTTPPAGRRVTYRFGFRQPVGAPGGELSVELATVPRTSQAIPWDGYATARISSPRRI